VLLDAGAQGVPIHADRHIHIDKSAAFLAQHVCRSSPAHC
jgi:hypothetical protein